MLFPDLLLLHCNFWYVDVNPVLLLYTNGGPDHRSTYMSVKLSMIALFRSRDLDMLVALRTAPSNSWANPVERIMSIVNTGLQGVGLMRQKMSEDFEKAVGKVCSKPVNEKWVFHKNLNNFADNFCSKCEKCQRFEREIGD